MLSLPIGTLASTSKVVVLTSDASVAEAAALMLANQVGAVLVVDDGLLAGIFTEHDIVSRVIGAGRDAAAVRLDDVMTREPLTTGPDVALGHALVLMQERGIRHLPVVVAGKPVGIVCARDALDPELEEFICEELRRKSYR